MHLPDHHSPQESAIEQAAADWTVRLDRGLTAQEQDDYSQWLSVDARHREAMALYRWGWDEFDRLAGLQTTTNAQVDPDLLAPRRRFLSRASLRHVLFAALPIAALIAIVGAVVWHGLDRQETSFASKPAIELIARIKRLNLDDGSTIELNRGAVVETNYTAGERRVTLVQGEAQFNVAKDPRRPFIVNVAGVDVRAVGTKFNVRLGQDAVNVIVTEGIVCLPSLKALLGEAATSEAPKLAVGDHATMKLGAEPNLSVTTLTPTEMDQALGWQPRLLDFDNAPLSEIVAEFNQRNEVRLVLGDRALESMRLSSSFWSDNVEGFVRLMESSFGLSAEWRGNTEIVLHPSSKR